MYHTTKYIHSQRLAAYMQQFKYIADNDVVLEIGKGPGVFQCLVSKVADYYSADIDETTHPDYKLDITNPNECDKLPKNFNKIFCCQVLEHIPFESALKGLENMLRLGADLICISIPDNRRFFRTKIRIPYINFTYIFTLPFTGSSNYRNKDHYWEIYSRKRCKEIINEMRKIANFLNYRIVDHYRLYERPYQHFVIFKRFEI